MFVLIGKEKSENINVKRSDEEVNLILDNKDVRIYAGNMGQEQELMLSLNDVAYALKQNHVQTVEDLCAMVSLLQLEVSKATIRGDNLETSLHKERDSRKAKSKEYERYVDQLLEKTNRQQEIIEDLKADKDEMLKLRHALITECQNVKGHNTSLKSENEKIIGQNSEANLKNHRLTTELEELKSQHQIVTDSNEHLKFDVKRLQSENEKCIKEINKIQFDLVAVKKDNDRIFKKYGELTLQYKALEKNDTVSNNFSIHYAEISDKTLKKELEKTQSVCAWTAQGLKEEKDKCINLQQENEKLSERVSHLDDSYDCLLNSSNETIKKLERELEKSKAVCEYIKAQFEDLNNEYKETITRNTVQKHKIKEISDKLSSAEDKCIYLKQELKNSNKNNNEVIKDELERTREYYLDTIRKITKQLEQAIKCNKELCNSNYLITDELEKTKDSLTEKIKELEILTEKHNESKSDVVHYLNSSEELKKDFFKSKDEASDLKTQKERLELNLRDSAYHYDCLMESTCKLSKEHKQLQVDFNKLTRSNIDRKKTLKDLNAKYEFLEEQFKDADRDLECSQKNRNELRTANEKLQQEVMQVKCSKVLVEKKLDDLVEKYKSSNLEVGNKMLTQTLDETKCKLSTAENNLIEITEDYDTAKEEIQNLKVQTSGLRKELGELKHKYEKIINECNELSTGNSYLQNEVIKLTSLKNSIESQLNEVQNRYKEIAAGKTIDGDEKLSEYKKQLETLKEKYTIELKENKRLSEDFNSLQCDLLKINSNYNSAKSELKELTNKLNEVIEQKSDDCNKEQIYKYETQIKDLNSSMKCWKKLQEETLERLNISRTENKLLTDNQQNPLGLKIDRLRLLLLKVTKKINDDKYKIVHDIIMDAEKLVRINKQCVNELTPIIRELNNIDDAKDVDWRIFVK